MATTTNLDSLVINYLTQEQYDEAQQAGTLNANQLYLTPDTGNTYGTVTSVGITNATNGGLSISGSPVTSSGSITVGHSNVLSSAQTTQAVYPIKIDKNGHISAYGSAITIPTKTSDLTNDSGFITSYVDEKVKQENTTSSSTYRVLLSGGANDTTSTTTSYKSTNLKFTPSTGNLQTTQINGVTVGSSPKFTDTNTISAWYGTCSSNSVTETKTVSCSGFTLSTGALIAVHFSYGNMIGSAIKLNVNNTGDKSIYYKGAAVSSSNIIYWHNDETILFSYDGTNYQYISDSFVVNEIDSSTSASILLSTDTKKKYKSSNLSFSSGASSNSPQLTIGSGSTSTGILTLGKSGYTISITPATLSTSRTLTLPNKTGTVALTSDIPSVYSSTNTGGYLTMATLPIYNGTVV